MTPAQREFVRLLARIAVMRYRRAQIMAESRLPVGPPLLPLANSLGACVTTTRRNPQPQGGE